MNISGSTEKAFLTSAVLSQPSDSGRGLLQTVGLWVTAHAAGSGASPCTPLRWTGHVEESGPPAPTNRSPCHRSDSVGRSDLPRPGHTPASATYGTDDMGSVSHLEGCH